MKIPKKLNPILIIIFISLSILWSFLIGDKEIEAKKYQKTDFKKEISGNAYVSDGDTIKFGRKRIRLLFIDAPETKQECLDGNNQKYQCGLMSKIFLINFINKRQVICKYNKKDIYKRYLAECFVEGVSINKTMVENGMAVVFSYQDFDPELKKLQQKAKKRKVGIWQGKFELPKDYRKGVKG